MAIKQNRLPLCVRVRTCVAKPFLTLGFFSPFLGGKIKNPIKWNGCIQSWKEKEKKGKNTNYHHHHTEFLLLLRSWYAHIITYKSFKIRVGSTIKILFIVQRAIREALFLPPVNGFALYGFAIAIFLPYSSSSSFGLNVFSLLLYPIALFSYVAIVLDASCCYRFLCRRRRRCCPSSPLLAV